MSRDSVRMHSLRMNSQAGVAILAITIILLLVVTIGTMMVGRVGLFEQKQTGVDVRSKEVYSAAVGGLEYGVKWYEDNMNTISFGEDAAIGDTVTLADDELPEPAELNVDTYTHQIVYTLKSDTTDEYGVPVVIEVASTATAANDSHVSKTVRVDVMLGKIALINSEGGEVLDGPPIMIEGCTTDGAVTGSPNVVYNYGVGVAIGTTNGTAGGATMEECIQAEDINVHLDLCDINNDPDSCSNSDAVSAEEALDAGVEFRDALEEPQSLWTTIFGAGVTLSDLKDMEQRYPEFIYIVDSSYPHYDEQPDWNGNTWHDNSGTADEPVIIYFDPSVGCPPINGSTTVHGLVYYAESDCGNQGWGGGTVFGTVAKSGDLQSFNANATIVSTSLDFGHFGVGDETNIPTGEGGVNKFAEVPGTWRDF